MGLPEQFKQYLDTHHAAVPGKKVLLAVSGGVDSMVMADLFLASGRVFAVAHCNFGLRGAESDGDEQFVRDWCVMNNVSFHTTRFDTAAYSAEWKKGTQETARILRYEWFNELLKEYGYAAVATAHHANDNVETLLINLFRGTGIAGLHGILPAQNNIIRPLLFATRAQISGYADEFDIRYREDSSNASDDYLRNTIRHHVIPTIEQWLPNVVDNVNDSIGRFGEAELLYRKAVEAECRKLSEKRGRDIYIPVRKLKLRKPLTTICYELMQPYGFSPAQVPGVLALLDAESGRYVSSATHRVIKDRDMLIVTTIPTHTTDTIVVEGVPCTVEADHAQYTFSLGAAGDISADPNVAMIDASALEFPLLLRKWKTGDYLYPLGMNMKKKKVSKLLIDAKMPLHEKEHVWVLESNKRIIWLAGMRIDERFRVKPGTEQVLTIKRSVTTRS